MRCTEERLDAVKRRARQIKAKRNKRRGWIIGFSAIAAGLLIVVRLSFLISTVPASAPTTDYIRAGVTASVFEIGSRAGYVLIGVLAFALGVFMSILFYRVQYKDKKDQDGDDD